MTVQFVYRMLSCDISVCMKYKQKEMNTILSPHVEFYSFVCTEKMGSIAIVI
jgi:hypothetical protein